MSDRGPAASRRRLTGPRIALLPLVLTAAAAAQPVTHPPANGMRETEIRAHAITNARVVIGPHAELEKATVIIRNGLIEAVGEDLAPPPDARIWPADGLTIYAGLIDAAVLVDVADLESAPGRHANTRVQSDRRIADTAALPPSVRNTLRSLGFTTAAVHPSSGIFRGRGAVLSLADQPDVYVADGIMSAGFDRGRGGYPGSLMGSIAVHRQTYSDAQWYAQALRTHLAHPDRNEPPAPQTSLAALDDVLRGTRPIMYDAGEELLALRADALAREFGFDLWLLGSGTEFRRLDEVVATGAPIILPLNYPGTPDVGSIHVADNISLRDLQSWEQAPTNPARLAREGVTIALTTHRLRNRNDFRGALQQAIRHGLDESDALAMLTTVPAELLGIGHLVGTVESGRVANLVIIDGSLFDEKATIRDVWVGGKRHEISAAPEAHTKLTGVLRTDLGHALPFRIDTQRPTFEVLRRIPEPADAEAVDEAAPNGAARGNARRGQQNEKPIRAKTTVRTAAGLDITIDGAPFGLYGYVRLTGTLEPDLYAGSGLLPNGIRFSFTAEAGEDHFQPRADTPADEEGAAPGDNGAAAGDDDGISGTWSLTARLDVFPDPIPLEMQLSLDADGSVSGTITAMGQPASFSGARWDPSTGVLEIDFTGSMGMSTTLRATVRNNELSGTSETDQFTATISGTRTADGAAAADARPGAPGTPALPGTPVANGEDDLPPADLALPLGAFGRSEAPQQEFVLLRGATIWTAAADGIIENGDLLIQDGRIVSVGPHIDWSFPRGAEPTIVDVTGKHITPGLIDCHSHTGISGGVNEFSHANTAEVRIGDVINPDDINWYRQLAGGLTAAMQLHGSANPIGGQSSIVKLKWGAPLEAMRVEGARPGIKFALGENVVRSPNRYPNTRMGVETFLRDAFIAAREYAEAIARYEALSDADRARTTPPIRDLELETLVEILEGERLVHCHSYRQDEILMLVRVAEEFGFRIGTFQHVLEGFKVAEAIAAHGAGASSFSDWWAFKVEVMDAIPHNGTLMTRVGVNVSFNSDSNELARRMNTEAAKAVRYGGLDPHEALKFVTINPAWQMGIDHLTGSLEVGKHADFVIWSGDPLSTYTRCEETWIEGARYFSLAEDLVLREESERERARIMQKLLTRSHGRPEAEPDAAPSDDEGPVDPTLFAHLDDEARQWMEQQVRLGLDPFACLPGDCGCAWPVFGMRP